MQGDINDGLNAFRVGLNDFPRFFICNIFVADTRQIHRLFLGITELEFLKQSLNTLFHLSKLSKSSTVGICEFSTCWNNAIVILLRELKSTIHEVTINGNQFVVATCLEVCPCEVVVFRLWRIGCEDIAEFVLTIRKFLQILVEPYCIVPGSGNLVSFQIQEFIGWNIVWKDIIAMCLQHRREDDAVEHDVVLSDEMDKTAFWVLPPLLPCTPFLRIGIAEFLRVADITDRSVKPHIEHLTFCSIDRYWDTPVEVASDSTRLQTSIEPTLALPIDIRAPLFVLLQNPLFQPRLVLIERKIPMFGATLHKRIACHSIIRVDEFIRRKGTTTFLALVTICLWSMTLRTFATNVTVSKEFT